MRSMTSPVSGSLLCRGLIFFLSRLVNSEPAELIKDLSGISGLASVHVDNSHFQADLTLNQPSYPNHHHENVSEEVIGDKDPLCLKWDIHGGVKTASGKLLHPHETWRALSFWFPDQPKISPSCLIPCTQPNANSSNCGRPFIQKNMTRDELFQYRAVLTEKAAFSCFGIIYDATCNHKEFGVGSRFYFLAGWEITDRIQFARKYYRVQSRNYAVGFERERLYAMKSIHEPRFKAMYPVIGYLVEPEPTDT